VECEILDAKIHPTAKRKKKGPEDKSAANKLT
jgi:hypothetical protein